MNSNYKISVIFSAPDMPTAKKMAEQMRHQLDLQKDCKEISTVVLQDNKVIKDDYGWYV